MKSPFNKALGKLAPSFLSRFDSATSVAGSLSSFLHGKPFEGVGAIPTNELYATFINSIPSSWQEKLYTYGGVSDSASYKDVHRLNAGEIDKWIYNIFPKKKYPAIAVGSCNGAMVNLCAAMGIPYLPQTFLVPIYKGKKLPKDEPKKTIEWSGQHAEKFLKNNPNWQLHQMMDPVQDRLRVSQIAYFRIKKLKLDYWYEKFIDECLEENGTLIVVDCGLSWPANKIADRHYFQFGGLGTIVPEEYYYGSPRVREFLKSKKAEVEQWDAPVPETVIPEAEWGFHKNLLQDVQDYVKDKNCNLSKISFNHPQDFSPLISEIYRWWYKKHGIPSNRLVVESFTIITPLLALKTGSVPYWLFFNSETAAKMLEEYLDGTYPYNEIYAMILSHGKHSLGLAEISRWRAVIEKAKEKHDFVGMDLDKFPRDLAIYARYSKDLGKKITERYELDEKLTLKDFEQFLAQNQDHFKVKFEEL